jgi:hypothetical protein
VDKKDFILALAKLEGVSAKAIQDDLSPRAKARGYC